MEPVAAAAGRLAENRAKEKFAMARAPSLAAADERALQIGVEALEAIYEVDQSPIGKTSRSTPATYIKVFDEIRNLFAQVPVSRMRGYSASRFSFNTDGGRCETCADRASSSWR